MTRFLLLMILILPCSAQAAGIADYVPPPMFGEAQVVEREAFPPLPPHRPDKLKASKSYIDYMRKYGRAPQVIQRKAPKPKRDILKENLVQPTAQDILDQINPQ